MCFRKNCSRIKKLQKNEDGINVPAGATLNIYGQTAGSGELYCDADTNDNAAIGADDEDGDCGTINIYGGTVKADTDDLGTDGRASAAK